MLAWSWPQVYPESVGYLEEEMEGQASLDGLGARRAGPRTGRGPSSTGQGSQGSGKNSLADPYGSYASISSMGSAPPLAAAGVAPGGQRMQGTSVAAVCSVSGSALGSLAVSACAAWCSEVAFSCCGTLSADL